MSETGIRASIEAFVAAWNERDATRRAERLEQACVADVHFRTSGRAVHGRSELDALIADFQRRMPGARAVFASAIDVQGRLFRYAGAVEDANGARIGEAFDAGECDDDGKIRVFFTFVGTLPNAAR